MSVAMGLTQSVGHESDICTSPGGIHSARNDRGVRYEGGYEDTLLPRAPDVSQVRVLSLAIGKGKGRLRIRAKARARH